MSRGFTLLELLVGLALMALLAGLLFGSLRLGAGTLARVDATAEALEDRRVVASFLRGRLAQAEPLNDATDTGHSVAFTGAPDRLELVTEMPPAAGGGRHRVVLDNAPGGLRLAWRPLPGDGAAHQRLLDVGPARFAYYGRHAGEADPSWHDTWTGELALPELVRLTLSGMAPLIVALPRDLASR
ncbi:MAG: prepilin-type N-terminal cleavage/methylation domain-containing protein [Alphaproteobacteria bacterium]